MLLGAKAFNALGWRAPQTCAIALYVVFAIISFLFSLPRSYKLFSWLAVVRDFSIMQRRQRLTTLCSSPSSRFSSRCSSF